MFKKICFIGGGLSCGGQERALSSMANYFAQKGDKVYIINLFKTEQFFEFHNGIRLIWPETDRAGKNRIVYALHIIPYLRKNIRKIKPDVLLSYGEWFNPFVILSTRFLNVPLFVLERMGPEIYLGFIVETSRRMLYRYASGVIVQTAIAAELLKKKTGVSNIGIIPNPVNVVNTIKKKGKKQIVTLGRLSKEKGHTVLLKAFASLPYEEWSLHLIGDGPEKPSLEKECQTLGIGNRVVFHGHVKNYNQIFGESEIFVLPSYYEGFPNALLEAMSVPLASISSNCVAGPSEIIENGISGLLVEPGNVKELAHALQVLIADKELRKNIADEGYKVRSRYSFDKIAQQYLDFIAQSIEAR